MRRLLFALMVWGFALSIGTGGALAGGGSDTTGEGLHCYLFFDSFPDEPDKFAQAMVNEQSVDVIIQKIDELLFKYEVAEGASLVLLTGNVPGVCGDACYAPACTPEGGMCQFADPDCCDGLVCTPIFLGGASCQAN